MPPEPPEPKTFDADELKAGMSAEFERDVTEADVLAFAANSGDWNPLHVDAAYAGASNYQGRIAHGAFQVGLASAMVGMHLPGRKVLLGSVNARFPAPLYYPCRVAVRGEVASWNRAGAAGQLRVVVREAATRVVTAEVAMGFTLHEGRAGRADDLSGAAAPAPPAATGPRAVVVTGASGGLGAAVVADLARDYAVLGMVNRQPLDGRLKALPNVREIRADLSAPGWPDAVAGALGGGPLYGVVHAAWPGVPRGGLLRVEDDALGLQLAFGTTHTVRLARLLFEHCDPAAGGRFVAIGSVFGSHRPTINLAAYSLGKSAMEAAVRLLAPEMALKRVTVNAVCPSFVPVGMNKQADERQVKLESARVPLGRPCAPGDVTDAVRHFLSAGAAFVSGEVLHLAGGQL